ncbi:hypothetical protein [Acinetobacter sp. YH12153]|uniref:hypothetical protein n=1 Tax=Acinetobacter sp. YH12153 TaxID=2601133 RepID=UPI0015D3DE2B|nr:hypothetical protein [Acinetobacter sp. YH12153]
MTTQNQEFTRDDFMDFFRNDEKLATLSNDDRLEIFMSIVPGSSDFTKPLLDELLSDYDVDHLEVIETTVK